MFKLVKWRFCTFQVVQVRWWRSPVVLKFLFFHLKVHPSSTFDCPAGRSQSDGFSCDSSGGARRRRKCWGSAHMWNPSSPGKKNFKIFFNFKFISQLSKPLLAFTLLCWCSVCAFNPSLSSNPSRQMWHCFLSSPSWTDRMCRFKLSILPNFLSHVRQINLGTSSVKVQVPFVWRFKFDLLWKLVKHIAHSKTSLFSWGLWVSLCNLLQCDSGGLEVWKWNPIEFTFRILWEMPSSSACTWTASSPSHEHDWCAAECLSIARSFCYKRDTQGWREQRAK